ncbi:MAG: hypothetical protein WKF30_00205 [Pyrinomonadaceae bacterium]
MPPPPGSARGSPRGTTGIAPQHKVTDDWNVVVWLIDSSQAGQWELGSTTDCSRGNL